MSHLLRFFSWRHARRYPARVLLSVGSIALGVALFVSSDVAQTTVQRAFQETIERTAGKARLRVTRSGGIGVDEEALRRIEAVPGVIAAPVLQRSAMLSEPKDGPMLVLGVDFWKDRLLRLYEFKIPPEDVKSFIATAFRPDGAVVTRRFADRHGVASGSRIVLDTPRGKAPLTVTGVVENEGPARVFGGNFLVIGLPTAQRLFTKPGWVDRIDVAPPPGVSTEATRDRIASLLGSSYSVEPHRPRSAVLEDAMTRIRSLVILSLIALIVGMFIIYNSVSISVVERTREMAILRSIGVRRRQILGLVLAEWSVLGLAGSALGALLGYLLAGRLVRISERSANALTLAIDIQEVHFSWTTALVALAAGLLASVLAALHPAIEAMKVPPAGLIGQSLYLLRQAPAYRKSFLAGAFLIVCSTTLVLGFYLRLPPYAGLAATTLIFVGVGLVLPQLVIWVAGGMRPALRALLRLEGYLAADNVAKFPQRTALTTIALGGALSMMVASSSFLLSLKRSADAWMAEGFPFDLTVSGTDMSAQLYSSARFPESLADEVRAVPGVGSVYTVSVHYQPFRESEIMLIGIDIEGFYRMHLRRGRTDRMKPLDDAAQRRRLAEGEDVIVSENFMNRYSIFPGDSLELETTEGRRRFRVARAIEEYSWPSGVVLMGRSAYRRLWKDDWITYIDVQVAPGAALEEVRSRIGESLKGTYTAFIYSMDEIRKIGMGALDQAFRLANVQVVIAILIGFLGILNTLLISVLRRTREIGLLRAVGASRAQIRRTVTIEASIIAGAAGLIGVGAGIVGTAFPLRLHMLQLTGYWVPLSIPWGTVAGALVAAVVIGWTASLLPARRAAKLNVLEAIAYE
ncbi:MAG: ABC transporter permease [Planctomycetes bacterium]|nr:ABC transporter permease [Planctomycetota bacterium]